MASRADEVRERIADLSELITAARKSLADLGEDGYPYAEFLRANLQATIKAVQRELARARNELQGARGLDAAADILDKVKTQAREARRAANWALAQAQAQRALERTAAQVAVQATLASTRRRAKKRKARGKRGI